MTFREDGAAALEWAARYLERVDELPVLAQVKPGEIRDRLPDSPPEEPEPPPEEPLQPPDKYGSKNPGPQKTSS